jgi:hypothetical protein
MSEPHIACFHIVDIGLQQSDGYRKSAESRAVAAG